MFGRGCRPPSVACNHSHVTTCRWDDYDVPIKVFRDTSFPVELPTHPRSRIANLQKVSDKWAVVSAFCKVDKPDEVLCASALAANGWWQSLFASEAAIWQSIKGDNATVVPACATPLVKMPVSCSSAQVAAAVAVYHDKCKPLLHCLDLCTPANISSHARLLRGVGSGLYDAFVDAAKADVRVAESCCNQSVGQPLYVCHVGDRVPDREPFDAKEHVEKGSIVLMAVEGEHAWKPWALARVVDTPYKLAGRSDDLFADVVYILPSNVKVATPGQDLGKCDDWGAPDVWINGRFKDWPLGRGMVWDDRGINLAESVWWACKPTKDMKFYQRNKDAQAMLAQVKRVDSLNNRYRKSVRPYQVTADPDATVPVHGTLEDDDD